ncbi:hypothetical protein ACO0OL_000976 [Hanseniaspora opuntiae]|uniref:37S ribosomal protein YMR-31, mitochondrial n=1 Tax=Hanseniaspora opuntiae TaxID=211096 RepID=A0A1E5R8G4_9ASCO|nr:hypothetical protein AWRI3578_g2938 [Hanseniaspora opuntiae]
MLSTSSVIKKQLFSTTSRSLYHYEPLIKFTFSKGDSLEIIDSSSSKSIAHPCSGSENLYPSSSECISAKEWLTNFFKPLVIKQYTPKKPESKPAPSKNNADNTKYIVDSNKFTRDLKPNELTSLSQLPKKFQFKPMEDNEMELINGGGIIV